MDAQVKGLVATKKKYTIIMIFRAMPDISQGSVAFYESTHFFQVLPDHNDTGKDP